MKGCLKQPSPMPSPVPECIHARKCVAFVEDGSEQVFFADEWDRTPAEPCRKLSYQDLIELREIQRSLPLANQPPDPTTGRPARQYLSGVPITLLPLLPEPATHHHHHHHHQHHNGHNGTQINPSPGPGSGSNSTDSASFNATPGQAQGNVRTPSHRNIIAAAAKTSPASNQHHLAANGHQQQQQQPCLSGSFNPNHFGKISNPTVRRLKPKFTFLPLLDTPPSSETTTPLTSNPSSRSASPDFTSDTDQTDPPTPSLTNASLDSPISCASSLSPEPTFLQLPPRHLSCGDDRCQPHFGPTDSYFPTALVHDADNDSTGSHRHLPPAAAAGLPPRKRNVMIVNGMEIELDQEEEKPSAAAAASSSNGSTAIRKRNVIIVNDMEIELDDDGDDNNEGRSVSMDSRSGFVSLPDSALRDCNSTQNLKPPERENGTKENFTSSTLASSPLFSPLIPSPPTSPTPTLSPAIHHAPIGRHPTCQSAPSSPDTSNDVAYASAETGDFGSLHIPLRFKRRTMSMESSHLSPL